MIKEIHKAWLAGDSIKIVLRSELAKIKYDVSEPLAGHIATYDACVEALTSTDPNNLAGWEACHFLAASLPPEADVSVAIADAEPGRMAKRPSCSR